MHIIGAWNAVVRMKPEGTTDRFRLRNIAGYLENTEQQGLIYN